MKCASGVVKLFYVVCVAAIFMSVSVQAKTNIDAYGSLPTIQLIAISPDGKHMAYRNTTDNKDALIIYSFEKKEVIDALGLSVNLDPQEMFFPTNDELVFVTGRRVLSSDRRESTAFVYSLQKKSVRQLLNPAESDVIARQTSLGDVVGISADKEWLYMRAFSTGGVAIGGAQKARYSMFRVKISKPKRHKVHFTGTPSTIDLFQNREGKVFVQELYDDHDNMHVVKVKQGKKWKEIYSKKVKLKEVLVVGLTPDYESLVVFKYDNKTGLKTYYEMSIEDGSLSKSEFSNANSDIEEVITDINRVVYGVEYAGFNPSYKFLDKELEARVSKVGKLFDGNSVQIVDWTENFENLIVYVEGSAYAGEYYYVPKEGKPSFLVASRPDVDYKTINPIAKFSYTASDGLKIPTLLTIPRDKVSSMKNLPAVMLPHGGPESYDRIEFNWMAQALAEQGYLVIQPQFRGSAGFGVEHRNAGYGEWGKKMQSDLTDGLDALSKKGYIDPSRVCIVGASYGGYAALAGGAFTPDSYKCVVSINGVSDLHAMIHSEKYKYGHDSWVVSYFETFIMEEENKKKLLKELSPIRYAGKFTAPVLLIHGEQDRRVRSDQSKDMRRALKKKGKSVKYVELKDETHNLVFNKTRVQALNETVNFVNEHLGGGS